MYSSWLSLIVLKLLLLLVRRCFCSLNPSCISPRACDISNIHYPFGIPNCSTPEPRTGFELACDGNISAGKLKVQLGNNSFEVRNISLDGQISILLEPFVYRCATHELEESQAQDQLQAIPNLENTPYTYNISNKFVVVGCDAFATISDHDKRNDKAVITGCASFCLSEDSIIEGSCSGVGCCQAAIPHGLKSFVPDFTSIRNYTGSGFHNYTGTSFRDFTGDTSHISSNNYGECSKAFVLNPDKFTFTKDMLRKYGNGEGMEVVLDWSIGSDCGNACVSKNSNCSKSKDVEVSRCNCQEGYQGNPYLENGCEDVDECLGGDHDCEGKCRNTAGGYECTCPFWTRGDGKRHGSGCRSMAPLDIGLGVGLGSLIIILVISSWSYCVFKSYKIRRLKQKYFLQNGGLLLQQQISSRAAASAQIFTAEELKLATDGFHESRVVGHGGYGTVYKGMLAGNKLVAIKRSKLVDEAQIEQFINEVVILSQVNHRNVVKLLGCCLETQVPLLVYEFIANGTLFQHLHASKTSPMSWETRLRIAVETAAALAYLHGVASIPIIHRDVKSANILVDENYTAKVSDFGASRLVPHNRTHITTLVQGTMGYLDPEYFHSNYLTDKSDVYSFGVVLVELLTREKPVSFGRSNEERNLAFHFVTLVEENRLLEGLDKGTVEEAGIKQLLEVAQLAKRCLNVKGEERPTMREVAVELEALRRLLKQHFVQEGKVYQTSPSTSLMINDAATEYSMKSMESHLLSESSMSHGNSSAM